MPKKPNANWCCTQVRMKPITFGYSQRSSLLKRPKVHLFRDAKIEKVPD